MLHARTVFLSLAVLALLGCGPSGTDGAAAVVDAAETGEGAAEALSGLDTAELQALAARALDDRNTYAPAGRNAVEYYLAIRDKVPGEAAVQSALVELQPYVLIAGEQAIGRGDLAEAAQLIVLLGRMDSAAPALPRLREQLQAAEDARLAAEALASLDIERNKPPAVTLAPTAGPDSTQERALEAERATVDRLVSLGRGPEQRPAATAPTGAARARDAIPTVTQPAGVDGASQKAADARSANAIARRELPQAPAPTPTPALPRRLKDVAPRYPIIALNRRIEGSVQVSFSIGADGSVSGARVVSATPENVFDRAALAAVSQWRFEATGTAVTTTRTLNFNLGGQG